ncbi:MAG TPA: alanine racemase [Terriglobales bacterium]|nr:alanine racemase [Terriglobales bacterium]
MARNWVEISRAALLANLAYVRQRLAPETEVCAVVKADAYGHGAVACARVFAEAGVNWMAVTSVEEGVRLRRAGIGVRILVLAGFTAAQAATMAADELTPAVWDAEQIEWLRAAMQPGTARRRFAIHLKLDTGMGRLGIRPDQHGAIEAALARAPELRVEAVFSHLAETEDRQLEALGEARGWARQFEPEAWHLLNSEAALAHPEWGGTLARVGLALYGYSADKSHNERLKPALSWKTHVISLKQLPAGHGVGYGPAYRTMRPTRVATIAAGYADGYRRDLWSAGGDGARVLIRGVACPVIGNISMDLTTVDVTDTGEIHIGDEVVLLGPAMPATRLAEWAATIPYEILCGLSARVERVYAA